MCVTKLTFVPRTLRIDSFRKFGSAQLIDATSNAPDILETILFDLESAPYGFTEASSALKAKERLVTGNPRLGRV